MPKRTRFACVFCLLLTQFIVLSVATPLTGFAQAEPQPGNLPNSPDLTVSTDPALPLDASAPANSLGIAHGAYLRPVFIDHHDGTWYSYGHEVMAYNGLVGKDLAIVMYFVNWSRFDAFLLDEIRKVVPESRRPTIMLTWQPDPSSSACDLGYSDGQGPLRAISSGRCDGYIHEYARALRSRPERFILRFAHEMNITDYPWWPGHYGLDAGSFIEMFRHVRDIFRAEGVTNVEWMWSPNYASNPPDAWNSTFNYYPGDAYVDWIGLSGYNWAGATGQPWREPEYFYDQVLRELGCRYAKPVIIAEVGSVTDGGDMGKANWISELYEDLDDYPFVRGIVWFNDFAYAQRGRADFRVTTGSQDCVEHGDCSGVQAVPGAAGQQATNAYINSLRKSVFSAKLPSLAQATPPYTLCSAPGQPFSLTSSAVSIKPGGTASMTLQGFMYSGQAQITFSLPSGIRGAASPATLAPPWGTSAIKLTADPKLAHGVYKGTIRVGSTALPVTMMNLKPSIYLPGVRR